MNSNCSNLLDLRNLQEQVKKAFCYQELFWPFTVWTNCSSVLKIFANSRPSASNFKSFSQSLEQFFLTVGQNNFGKVHIFWEGHKFCEIFTLLLSYVVPVKIKLVISQNFVAFSEYMNFNNNLLLFRLCNLLSKSRIKQNISSYLCSLLKKPCFVSMWQWMTSFLTTNFTRSSWSSWNK